MDSEDAMNRARVIKWGTKVCKDEGVFWLMTNGYKKCDELGESEKNRGQA